MNNNKEKLQPTKLYLNKDEYNKLYEVLSLNERRDNKEKSSKATERLFPIEIKFIIEQFLDFVNYMPSKDYFEELREETIKRKQSKEE